MTNFLKWFFRLISFNAQLTADLDSLIRPSCLVKKVLDPMWGWKEIKKDIGLKVLRCRVKLAVYG